MKKNKLTKNNFVKFSILFLFIVFGFCVMSAQKVYANIPDNTAFDKIYETAKNYIDSVAKDVFVSYSISKDVNKFYIDDAVWEAANLEEKFNAVKIAAFVSAEEKNKNVAEDDYMNKTSHNQELGKTKIYLASTKQLVAEVNMPKYTPDMSFAELMKASMNAFKVYPVSK